MRTHIQIRDFRATDAIRVDAINRAAQAATGHPSPGAYPPGTLAATLAARPALRRFVAEIGGEIVGHILIEPANPQHGLAWHAALGSHHQDTRLIEVGGAFVDPAHFNQGIFSQLLTHAIHVVRADYAAIPVCATWSDNAGVIHKLRSLGAIWAGQVSTRGGTVELFTLPRAVDVV